MNPSLIDSHIYYTHLQSAADYIQYYLTHTPKKQHHQYQYYPLHIALVLGSGLNNFANELHDTITLPYSTIPYMPQPHVSGHDGNLVIGRLLTREKRYANVMCFAGRVHVCIGQFQWTLMLYVIVITVLMIPSIL
jgi:hypothetical protein